MKLLTPVPSLSYYRQTKKDRLVSDLHTLKVQKKNKNKINHLKIKRSETDREILNCNLTYFCFINCNDFHNWYNSTSLISFNSNWSRESFCEKSK